MVSTVSRHEKAGAMCNAETVCEMSRMRRRKARQRRREAAASNRLCRGVIERTSLLFAAPDQALLDDRPIIGAGIAGLREQLPPSGGIMVGPRREDPAEKDLLLLRRAVGVDLDVAAPGSQPLD